ncbi:MAG: hypothetical protein JO001_13695 [Alphaproteobacteria bacterium]|nr:hypothetical protein [Alphaproteobacteria bacterium]
MCAASATKAARRLARLFRIERTGGFDRRPVEIAEQIIGRRGQVINALGAFYSGHRLAGRVGSAELDAALQELSIEVERSIMTAEDRHHSLGVELHFRRGETLSGMRTDKSGRLLARG